MVVITKIVRSDIEDYDKILNNLRKISESKLVTGISVCSDFNDNKLSNINKIKVFNKNYSNIEFVNYLKKLHREDYFIYIRPDYEINDIILYECKKTYKNDVIRSENNFYFFKRIINPFESNIKFIEYVIRKIKSKKVEKPKNIDNIQMVVEEKDDRLKILLIPDTKGWAFDNIANAIINYNPYPDKIKYEIAYIIDISRGSYIINYDEWDYIYVFFEAEEKVLNRKNVIRGCYSAFWLENEYYNVAKLGSMFSDCRGGIFANDYLKNSILSEVKNDDFRYEVITDATNEELFYPIKNVKNVEFTAIFVGNKNRKVKNYKDIQWICKEAGVKLITCTNMPNSELVNEYNKADVCINFSDFEGGPQTFLEAGLCEVPMLIRNNNELSKLIPCFTGKNKNDFVKILKKLKKNRSKCKEVGKKAREVILKDFTYKKTAMKFADFFLGLNKRDLKKDLTVFIIRSGENPNYSDCLNALKNQNCIFNIKEVVNVAPMSKAFQEMIDTCETEYYIQVDEDMILEENSIETIYESIKSSDDNICNVAFKLRDIHLDFNIYGIKGYKHNILRNYPYNLEIISCEVDQMMRLQNDGYETLLFGEVVGQHSPKWTNELIFERYFDLMEKWKVFKYDWLSELPSKLLQIFRNNPIDINLYALMGAFSSISSNNLIRKREKNFMIKDENFEKTQQLLSIEKFNFIKSDEVIDKPQILKKEYVKNGTSKLG
jgi:glycosyltransferase involved in cell wall biosynthesis